MKKRLVSLLLLTALFTPLFSAVEITPVGGLQWNGTVHFWEGDLGFDHRGNLGVFINVDLQSDANQLELSYTNNPTTARWSPFYGYGDNLPANDFDVVINYWQVGGLKTFGPSDALIRPYGQLSLGLTYFSFSDPQIDGTSLFSVTAGLGVKIMLNDVIGIRLGSRFMMPISFDGVGFYYGNGGGGTSAYGSIPLLQGDIHGGLIIRIGGGSRKKKSASLLLPNNLSRINPLI